MNGSEFLSKDIVHFQQHPSLWPGAVQIRNKNCHAQQLKETERTNGDVVPSQV